MKQVGNILNVLDRAESRAITVFGDYCLDKYLYIDPVRDEPSVETGLTAYQVEGKKLYPGAAGTVTNNLRSLGARVQCVGLVGDDGEGYELLQCLKKIGAETDFMVRSESIPTNTYTKPMRKSADGTYTEMNRFDIRSFRETSRDLEDKLLENLTKALDVSQGVIIIEQYLQRNYAAVTDRIRDELAEMSTLYPDKFFFADSRGFAGCYRNVIIKCNQLELPGAEKDENIEDEDSIIRRAKKLLEANNARAVVVTVGAKGALVFERESMTHTPAFVVEGPVDIVGAGDATNAGTMLGLTLGLSLPESVLLGGCVSSITIQQIGVTGTATIEQVKQRLRQ
ncbi:MAG: PfkB family carbohydrate kinase [Planctomycetaceae bacterium]|jgi:rfaE bifunctional protein kinase chain/domain|nr:PfkB family carbohydrate kinase [Planctomycetaceae bacterium]